MLVAVAIVFSTFQRARYIHITTCINSDINFTFPAFLATLAPKKLAVINFRMCPIPDVMLLAD